MAEHPPVSLPSREGSSLDELSRTYNARVSEVVLLEKVVAELALDLAWFHAGYAEQIGRLAVELADLEVETARQFVDRRPEDLVMRERLRRAEVTAARRQATKEAACDVITEPVATRSPDARAMFLEFTGMIHRNLIGVPARARSGLDALSRLSALYAKGDMQGLNSTCSTYRPDPVQFRAPRIDDSGAMIEAITWMDLRIGVLRGSLEELKRSQDATLREEMLGPLSGFGLDGSTNLSAGDPVARLSTELARRIRDTRHRLAQLGRSGGRP